MAALYVHIFIMFVLFSSITAVATTDCSLLSNFMENMSRIEPKQVNCCLWDGVECSSGHVIALDLSNKFLSGPIHSNTGLFNLSHLRLLNLAYNDLQFSQIPSQIGYLSRLTYLNFSYSLLSGHVPKEISHLTQLVSLDLSGNCLQLQSRHLIDLVQRSVGNLKELNLAEVYIDSQLPDILANSSSLTSLNLTDCGLFSDFPIGIFHLPSLQFLDVQNNSHLSGYLPEFHANSKLKHVSLSYTSFQGEVPTSVGSLIHLNHLDLSGCLFKGSLPGSISNLTQLTYLNLAINSFSGRIPSLASLSKLTYLSLRENMFNLVDYLGNLPNLYFLDLSYNNLSIEIPLSIWSQKKLRELHLNNNRMVGQIPSSLMNLSHLTILSLADNKFTGHLPSLENLSDLTFLKLNNNNFNRWKLPDWLGKLKKLVHLHLEAVNLHGEIPSSIFNLTQLQLLALGMNHLTGPIPRSMQTLGNLEVLSLSDNNFIGTLEFDIFFSLTKLKRLYLNGNKITLLDVINQTHNVQPKFTVLSLEFCNLRFFPNFLRLQDQLYDLRLDGNKIDGLIPDWLWKLSKDSLIMLSLAENLLTGFEKHSPVSSWAKLLYLDLSHNMLTGSIPLPPPTTQTFMASNNKLTGEIPQSICELQSLHLLDLSFNHISGSIPPCMDRLSNLSALNLESNNLQGPIPITFTCRCNLEMINLSNNRLEGHIPRSLEYCTILRSVDFGNNNMDDIFPFWLATASELRILNLRSNRFHGPVNIPSKTKFDFSKLHILDLSNNHFSGNLPQRYFEVWSAMKEADATTGYMHLEVKYYDVYYADFYILSGNYSFSTRMNNKGKTKDEEVFNIFKAVDLSSNKFTGEIPESIAYLREVQLLNLSNNDLSGVIPSSMENLEQLESLDLSRNNLSGNIPQELVYLHFLVFFNVSFNNLTGPIPYDRQFTSFQKSSYIGNPALCGEPVLDECRNSSSSFDDDTESVSLSEVSSWSIILSAIGTGLAIGVGMFFWVNFERFRCW